MKTSQEELMMSRDISCIRLDQELICCLIMPGLKRWNMLNQSHSSKPEIIKKVMRAALELKRVVEEVQPELRKMLEEENNEQI